MSETTGELVERVRQWAAERVCPHCGHDVCGSEPGYLRCSACAKRSRESQWVARSPDVITLCARLEAAEAEVAQLREEVARLRLERSMGEDVTDEEDAAICAALGGAVGGAFGEPDWEAIINALPAPVGAVERVLGAPWSEEDVAYWDRSGDALRAARCCLLSLAAGRVTLPAGAPGLAALLGES